MKEQDELYPYLATIAWLEQLLGRRDIKSTDDQRNQHLRGQSGRRTYSADNPGTGYVQSETGCRKGAMIERIQERCCTRADPRQAKEVQGPPSAGFHRHSGGIRMG